MEFTNLKLYREYPGHLCGKHPVRLYTTDFSEDSPDKVRWHVGWPKELLPDEFLQMLECDIYMFGSHWTEHEGFLIFWTMVCEPLEPFPSMQINRQLNYMVKSYNQVLNFFRKAADCG
jgi:hypothetical protein